MKRNNFYLVNEPGGIVSIDINLGNALPILWNQNGRFCVVPLAVVQNIIESEDMHKKLIGKRTRPEITLHWSQGIPISNLAGRALIGE